MERKTHWFKKYYPSFCTGFESKFDYTEFKNWKSFIKRYVKEFPLRDDFEYATSQEDNYCHLVAVSEHTKEHWVVGKTDVNLSKYYKDWKYILSKEDFE